MHPLRAMSKRERAFFMEGTLDLPAYPIYVIPKSITGNYHKYACFVLFDKLYLLLNNKKQKNRGIIYG